MNKCDHKFTKTISAKHHWSVDHKKTSLTKCCEFCGLSEPMYHLLNSTHTTKKEKMVDSNDYIYDDEEDYDDQMGVFFLDILLAAGGLFCLVVAAISLIVLWW